jgi:hypothetical protein
MGQPATYGGTWKPALCTIMEAEGTMADGTMADGTTWTMHVPDDGIMGAMCAIYTMGAMCALWELHHHVGAAGAIWELLVPYGSHMHHTGTV